VSRVRAAAWWVLLALAGFAAGAVLAWAAHSLTYRPPPALPPVPAIFTPMPQAPG
jgi:hypothetical protein